jgi:hypothetical protein
MTAVSKHMSADEKEFAELQTYLTINHKGCRPEYPAGLAAWAVAALAGEHLRIQELDAAAGAMHLTLRKAWTATDGDYWCCPREKARLNPDGVYCREECAARELCKIALDGSNTAGKSLLERLEKMRNCGNCKYSPDGDNGCNCIPGDCIERDYEHWQWEGEVSG